MIPSFSRSATGFSIFSAGPTYNACLDAFVVALNQTWDGKRWYTSNMQLQLASVQMCAACRSVTKVVMIVDDEIPRSLLAAAEDLSSNKRLRSSRVPRLRAHTVLWFLRSAAEMRRPIGSLVDASEIYFYHMFIGSLEGVVLPRRLKKLHFDPASPYNEPIVAVTWPDTLQQITFGEEFDQPINGVSWPPSLLQLKFSLRFNQPVEETTWPSKLIRVEFGLSFDQPIEAVAWPNSIRQMWFGHAFNRPITHVNWPASLWELKFEGRFNHPISGVVWPASLQQLTFGDAFNQPIEGVTWPISIRQLSFGRIFVEAGSHPIGRVFGEPGLHQYALADGFDQPIGRVVWPKSLQRLAFGDCFNQPIDGVTWPDSLRECFFGRMFNQPIDRVVWPASLCDVCFGAFEVDHDDGIFLFSSFDQAIDGPRWPASIRRLTLGRTFRHSLEGLGSWMPNLAELCLLPDMRSVCEDLLRGIEWPSGLRTLTVYRGSNLESVGVPQSVQVDYRTVSRFEVEMSLEWALDV